MRTLLAKVLTTFAVALMILALPMEGAQAGDNNRRTRVPAAPVYNPVDGAGQANYSPLTVEGVADGRPKSGHVWRGDLVMTDADGSCRLLWEAAVRSSAFVDGLERQSLEIRPDPDGTVIIVLPSTPRNNGERWAVSRHLSGSKRIPVRFLHKGKVVTTLPPEFIRTPIGTLGELLLDAKELREKGSKIVPSRNYWVSAGEFLPDQGVLAALNSPIFEKEFSDEWGGAATVSRDSKRGLVFGIDSVDRGLDTWMKQSEDPAVFDRSRYHRALFFTEKGANLTGWPDRLSRFDCIKHGEGLDLGTKFYVSAGDQYIRMRTWGGVEAPNFGFKPGALASMTPFRDQFGWSYEITRIDYAFGAKIGITGIPEPRWIFRVYDRFLTDADVEGYLR